MVLCHFMCIHVVQGMDFQTNVLAALRGLKIIIVLGYTKGARSKIDPPSPLKNASLFTQNKKKMF